MGRRTTSTTKGGRYMNPADQERKMARKKELKKNKKQRHMVRQAVLKSKDPLDLLRQMEHLDEMEFSDFDSQSLSDRVIQEKRNKLRETFLRVMGMYRRENEMEKFQDLKQYGIKASLNDLSDESLFRHLQFYDQKRLELQQQFTAQKFAREVSPAEIPLPDAAPPPPDAAAAMTPAAALAARGFSAQQLNLLPPSVVLPDLGFLKTPIARIDLMGTSKQGIIGEPLHGILKKSKKRSIVPPGPPIGIPPELSDSSDDEYSSRATKNERASRSVRRSSDDRNDSEDDRNIAEDQDDIVRRRRETEGSIEEFDEYEYDEEAYLESSKPRVRFDSMAADEMAEKDSRSRYKELAKKIERGELPPYSAMEDSEIIEPDDIEATSSSRTRAAIPPPSSLTMGAPGVISGPPQLIRPPLPIPGLGNIRLGMGLPPPPPGLPPGRMQRPSFGGYVPSDAVAAVGAVLSAPPTVNKNRQPNVGAIIEAKPQLRNMQQEITKLVPTAVKVRREQHAAAASAFKKPKGPLIFRTPEAKVSVPGSSVQHVPQKSSDEAYDEFMKEMQSLL